MHSRTMIACLTLLLLAGTLAVAASTSGCGNKKGETTVVEDEVSVTAPGVDEKPGEDEKSEPEETEDTSPSGPVESVDDAVKAAALEYAEKAFPNVSDLEVLSVKVLDFTWGRVTMQPADRSTDAAAAYLKLENGNWVVFDFGTGITPEAHPEAPPSLFK